MKLADIMVHPLEELVQQCNVTSIKPIADDNGNIKKVIIEYEPHDAVDIKIPEFMNGGNGVHVR